MNENEKQRLDTWVCKQYDAWPDDITMRECVFEWLRYTNRPMSTPLAFRARVLTELHSSIYRLQQERKQP